MRTTWAVMALCFLPVALCAADPADSEISFFKHVLPILRQRNCTGCHQPAKKGGEYVMTDFAALMKGGESGEAAVVAGDPKKSYLLGQITPGKDGKAEMPKDAPPLSRAEIETITKWIASGAKDDTPASNRPQYDAAHPPIYMAAPALKSVEFSPDGALLAVAGYHEVLLHKAARVWSLGWLARASGSNRPASLPTASSWP
jgi:mono/diheme cytochrome c family protein